MSSKSPIVLFVCEHGSAKSTIAAAHFNKLARERSLNIRAISRGTDPDDAYPANVIAGLLSDGLQPEELQPMKLSNSDVATAAHIIVFSELLFQNSRNLSTRDWSDVPAVSEDYGIARDEIVRRVSSVLDELFPDEIKDGWQPDRTGREQERLV